ncbi:hypothetical protein HAX54_040449, partial [Datura stramonium]|nr:hypothetical protein [Datura stramonium]
YESHAPPVHAAEAPAFIAPVTVRVPYEVDQYAKIEKDIRMKEEDSITSQLHSMRRALKS